MVKKQTTGDETISPSPKIVSTATLIIKVICQTLADFSLSNVKIGHLYLVLSENKWNLFWDNKKAIKRCHLSYIL